MCGRFALMSSWAELQAYFDLLAADPKAPDMPPRYNIAPTQPILAIRNNHDGVRESVLVRWGLMPSWVKDPQNFTTLINARSETITEKPSFKAAIRHRRVLIPASGFYEWQRFGKNRKSQPYWVHAGNNPIIAFGGVMETWAGANGSEIDTACIISTEANDSFAPIHHRLPLVIQPQDFDRWLNCKTQEPKDILDLMQPAKEDYFQPVPVSDAVNKVINDNPSIQHAVEPDTVVTDDAAKADTQQLSMF